MNQNTKITVVYKPTSFFITPPYWCYKEAFPNGWIWLSVDHKHSEEFEFFEGPNKTKEEMIVYLKNKFLLFQNSGTVRYFKIFED